MKKLVLYTAVIGLIGIALGIALFCVIFFHDCAAYEAYVDSILQQEQTDLIVKFFGGAAYAVSYSIGMACFCLFTGIYLLTALGTTIRFLRRKTGYSYLAFGLAALSFTELLAILSYSLLMKILFNSLSVRIASLILGIFLFAIATTHTVLCFICAARIRHMQNVPPPETPLSQ